MSNYNNIFNKKNIEFELDGAQNVLPHTIKEDVSLKANQIIFTSINNIFQKLLDNDLYNEALLKKYIEFGVIGGPTYVSSISQVEDSPMINKKFVVSGENGISVLRKDEVNVIDTLSGRYLDGTKVNKLSFINGRFVACTENGIYESLDKVNWTRRIGEDGKDVIDITYNQNFLNQNIVSAYDYIAVANSPGKTITFYGHDGTDNSWVDFSADPNLISTAIKNNVATSIFSFDGDPLLYVGTRAKGLFASSLTSQTDSFQAEFGTNGWTVNDMAEIPNENAYENYFLATNYGMKQSRKEYGFRNLKKLAYSSLYVYDALKDRNNIYVATGEGLLLINQNEEVTPIQAFSGMPCYAVIKANGHIYVGTCDGVYLYTENGVATRIGLERQSVQNIASLGGVVFAYDSLRNAIVYSKNNSAFSVFNLNLSEHDEHLKQLVQNRNVLYAVTDKNVYAIVNAASQLVFSWTDSCIASNNVYFAQNLSNGSVLLQANDKIHILASGDINTSTITIDIPNYSSQRITCAIYGFDEYFVLMDGALYRIFDTGNDTYSFNAVMIDGEQVTASKIAFYDDRHDFKGIVLLNENNTISLLQYEDRYGTFMSLIPIAGVNTFNDIAVYKDGIYALDSLNSSKSITKYSPTQQYALNEVADLSEKNNGVSLTEYLRENGIIDDKIQKGDTYLSTFSDSIMLEVERGGETILATELKSFDDLDVSCADFVGYVKNVDEKNTLLVGKGNGVVNAFSIGFDSELTTIESNEEIIVKNPPQRPNAFADSYYRDEHKIVKNAMNFVGAEDGAYFISANPNFVKELLPNEVTRIYDSLSIDVDEERYVYIGTDAGAYIFDPFEDYNFVNANVGGNIRNLSKFNGSIIANGDGTNILISSVGGEESPWDHVYGPDLENEFSISVLDDPTQYDEFHYADLSSDYGFVLSARLSTISFENQEAEDYIDGRSDQTPGVVNKTIIFDNTYQIIFVGGSILSNEISSLYVEDGQPRICDIYGNVHNLNISKQENVVTLTVQDVVGAVPRTMEEIFNGKMANFFELGTNLFIGENLDSGIFVTISPVEPGHKKELISVRNDIAFNNVSDIDLAIATSAIHIPDWNKNPYLCCTEPILSTYIDFSNNEIKSVDISAFIEISSMFLSNHIEYVLQEVWEIDPEDEMPYRPVWEGDSPSVIISPDGRTATMNPGDYISTWTERYTGEKDSFIMEYCLSSQDVLSNDKPCFILSDYNSLFSDKVSAYALSINDINYQAVLHLGNIKYNDGFDETNSSLSLSYLLSSNVEYSQFLNKEVPLFQETNDGIYYNNVYWNDYDPYGNKITKRQYSGYCIKDDSSDIWLMLEQNDLYAFDNFKIRNRTDTLGLVQIAASEINENFNDLYYFKAGENFDTYPIRKTLISNHGKNFSDEKYSQEPGDIIKMSVEDNTVYVVKGSENDNDLYYTDLNTFPNFEKINLNDSSVDDIASCEDYTFVRSGSVIKAFKNASPYGEFEIPSDSNPAIGTFGNFFSDGSTIYIKTEDFEYPSNGGTIYSGAIWHPYKNGTQWLFERKSIFNKSSDVKAVFNEEEVYNSDIIIGDAYLYAVEKLYDFKDTGYKKIAGLNEKVVDLKVLSGNTSTPILYAATETNLYQCTITGFDSNAPVFSQWENKSTDLTFTNIKSIYFLDDDLYLLDGLDLYLYRNFTPDKQLSECDFEKSNNFLPDDEYSNKVTFSTFKDLEPAIVKKDSVNTLEFTRRFVKQDVKEVESTAKLFKNGLGSSIYLYSSNRLQKINSNYDEKDFSLQLIGQNNNGYLVDESTCIINDSMIGDTRLWGVSTLIGAKTIKEIKVERSSNSSEYRVMGDPNVNALFYLGNTAYLGVSGNGPGLYKITSYTGFIVDPDNRVSRDAETLTGDIELAMLEFYNDEYILNYIDKNLSDTQDNKIQRSLFKSSDFSAQTDLNKNYISNGGATALAYVFNKYLFVSDGAEGYIYKIAAKNGSKISLSQLEQLNGGLNNLMFLKDSNGLGLLGYGNMFATFDEFSNIKIYDNVNQEKYVAVANNFTQNAQKIEILNSNPDLLIGTSYGLKYVYDRIMTRSFYNKQDNIAIKSSVNTIEKVIDASNNDFFIVGQENSVFEITNLRNTKFRKLFNFDEDEIVLDVYSIQKNEYIIATTKGIYITALKYDIKDDLKRFTIDNIYDIINSELKKIIEGHIAKDHTETSLIHDINLKAGNDMSFISAEDKHKELYDSSLANSVKIVENDIIDTIVRGGETPDSDSYVKVGIKNWAMSVLNPVATYTNDGFVNGFTDASSGKKFDISVVPYVVKNWKSGLKEIYIYVPSTGTYYANNPQGISNSQYSYNPYYRANVPNTELLNTLPEACTTLRVYLYNSYFNIKTILAAQCVGNSLPLKIYKDNVNADDMWKGVFDTVIQPSALRTLPMTNDKNVNNVRKFTDESERICLDFSIYGTDAQAIRIIAES